MTDPDTQSGFRPIGESEVFSGFVFRVVQGDFATPDGTTMRREIVRHPGAVGVVAVDREEVVLVRQYRAAVDATVLEIPAGKRDVAGEAPATTAARELAEEVGFEPGSMQSIGGFHNSVGFCDEYIHLFLATDLRPVATAHEGPEEAHMTVERMALTDIDAAIDDGTLTDAKTIIGLRAALRQLGR